MGKAKGRHKTHLTEIEPYTPWFNPMIPITYKKAGCQKLYVHIVSDLQSSRSPPFERAKLNSHQNTPLGSTININI